MPGSLDGIRVVDFTRALAGPYCTMILGDLGAEVVKIEQPGSGDDTRGWGPPFINGQSAYFLSINRNKKSLTLDLKQPAALEIVRQLVDRADVVVENFRPGTMDRFGLGYSQVSVSNPRLVYCAISGFGQEGPRANQPAYDQIIQGMSGAMSLTGPSQGPPSKFGIAISDIGAGMWAAMAIGMALFHRERSGQGQFIDTSMIGGLVALLTFQAGRYFATGDAPGLAGNRHPTVAPYETFATADGWANVACGTDLQFRRFCSALGLEELLVDERFTLNAGRIQHQGALNERLLPHLARLATAEVVAALEAAEVPVGPVFDLAEVFADPQAQHLGLRKTMQHPVAGEISVTGFPWQYSATPAELHAPPPLLGEHNDEILATLGYSADDLGRLRDSGAI